MTDEALSPVPATKPFHHRKRWWFAGICVALVAAVISVVLFAVPLPVSLVAPHIVSKIEAQLGPGYDVNIGQAVIERGTDGLELRLDQFIIRDPGKAVVLSVSSAVISLDGDLVLGRRAGARRIKLVNPTLTVRVDEKGNVTLAAAEGNAPLFRLPESTAPKGTPAEILGLLATGDILLKGPLSTLEVVEVVDGSLVLDDLRRHQTDSVDGVDIRIARRSDGEGLTARASSSRNENWSASITLQPKPDATREMNIGFENLPLARLLYEARARADAFKLSGQISGHVQLQLAASGAVPQGAAEFDVNGARLEIFNPVGPTSTTDIEAARLEANWNGGERLLHFKATRLQDGKPHSELSVTAQPQTDALDGPWSMDAQGTRNDKQLQIKGIYESLNRVIVLNEVGLQGPDISLHARGRIELNHPKPLGDLTISTGKTSIGALLDVWPTFIAFRPRDWMEKHIKKGTITSLNVITKGPLGHIEPPEERELSIDAAFEDASLKFLDDAPAATEGRGTVTVRGNRLDVNVSEGKLRSSPNDVLIASDVHFSAADIRPEPLEASLVLKAVGSLGSVGVLLTSKAVQHVTPSSVDLAKMNGVIDGTLKLEGKFGPNLPPGSLRATVDATLKNLAVDAFKGFKIEGGPLDLHVSPPETTVSGQAKFGGAPLSLEVRAKRQPDGKLGETMAAFTVDPSKIAGLSNNAVTLAGPVSVRLSMSSINSLDNADVQADITGAAIRGASLIDKKAGQSGQVKFHVSAKDGGWSLENASLDSGALALRGTATLDAGGALTSARLSTFRLSQGDDARLDLDRSAPNQYRATVRGGAFNVRTLVRDMLSGGSASKDQTSLDLDAKLGTAIGHNGQTATGVDMKLSRRGGRITAFTLNAGLGAGQVRGQMINQQNGAIYIGAADAGAVFRFVDIYNKMRGGVLDLQVIPGRESQGVVSVRDFAVVDEKALATVASARQPQNAERLATNARFTKMRAIFQRGNGRLNVNDAAIWGPDVGATLEGAIDYGKNWIDVRGTFVPAYALNNLFSKLPIIGAILGGGANEGLFGVTFQVQGPVSGPTLRVNPISAVAPGFLRKLFEFRNANDAIVPPAGVARE